LIGLTGKSRKKVGFAAVAFLLEASTQLILHRNQLAAEYVYAYLLIVNYTALMVVGLRRAVRSFHLSAHWFLLCAGGGIYAFSIFWDLWASTIFPHVPVIYLASCQDLMTVLDVIPVFVLISLPAGRRYFRHFIWIDLTQVILAAYLLYVVVLHVLPFTSTPVAPLDRMVLTQFISLLDLCATAALLLHCFAAVALDEKRFFGAVSLISLLSFATNLIFNRLLLLHQFEPSYNVPFLALNFFTLALYLLLPAENGEEMPSTVGLLADLINIASPALPSAALLALGIAVEPRFHLLGIWAMAAAFLLFAFRATIYQRSFEKAQATLERMSYTDGLTGVANRRAFEKRLLSEWERGTRSGSPLSLIIIDVDFFKHLNDTQGHHAGDACLVSIAQALQAALPRKLDLLGRYGGDEFAAVLPSTNADTTEVVAQRLWEAVRDLSIEIPGVSEGRITASLGAGTCTEFQNRTSQFLFSAADEALYKAKAAGRNCWRSFEKCPSEASVAQSKRIDS
jgi:diguanylate cyclase (GGDEF)-like protein